MAFTTDIASSLVTFTERVLTRRKKRRLRQKMKQQSKHWLRDWAEAILWAVCMVLIINQYAFQMYTIPSGSMSGTLEINDRIFVNKFVYGPELLPGILKMPGLRIPERGEVVVFENPAYLGKGPVFTVLQQFVYMITLTFVDIDKDEFGHPRVHYLIKRAVGVGGDTLRAKDGEMSFLFRGSSEWISEREYQERSGFAYPLQRLVRQDEYEAIYNAGKQLALRDMGLGGVSPISDYSFYDEQTKTAARYAELAAAYPHDMRIVTEDRKIKTGWFIPEDRIFTMGDNRDNSKDARWFGAVRIQKVLGHALFKYWPLSRVGGIR